MATQTMSGDPLQPLQFVALRSLVRTCPALREAVKHWAYDDLPCRRGKRPGSAVQPYVTAMNLPPGTRDGFAQVKRV
ncbi:hypothetical protein [Streptomyces cellulosae]|uniref:hypothetical protein n=1 Tax=Streptomyces cellulosae TaxID=1968 RepID=UPI0004C7F4BF|nr:hypothetical protein [Streptomyces cellulosae]